MISQDEFNQDFTFKTVEDCLNLKIETIDRHERILNHIQTASHAKSWFLKPVYIYTILFTKSVSSIFSLVSLFVTFKINAEYFQILLVSVLFELLSK
jgi:hypothetical protein